MEETIERVVGPHRGYFIAVYTTKPTRGNDCIAYFKVSASRPDGYFDSIKWLLKGCAGPVAGADVALDVAVALGRQRVEELLPPNTWLGL